MASALIENSVLDEVTDLTHDLPTGLADPEEADIMSELGIWLAGLTSFLAVGNHLYGEATGQRELADMSREFHLTRSVLMRCSRLNSQLMTIRLLADGPGKGGEGVVFRIGAREHREFSDSLRDAIVLNDLMARADTPGFVEWKAWCSLLSSRFDRLVAARKLISFAEESGEAYLPDKLREIMTGGGSINMEHAELRLLLPRFAKILKWLSVVGLMLKRDEPLKPALIIFSRVNEQIHELINYINNRLAHFEDEEAELFSTLDAAAYTASIELKKVYSQELTGVTALRPATTIYARMETAHSLLSESFQQIIAGFTRLVDPESDIFTLFPNFRQKFERSLILRQELWAIVNMVQAAEKSPEKREVESLNKTLREFMADDVGYLFYKDTETFERFVEEIRVTKQKKDLVPILHRFGAYLETLFAQVNMRSVLERSPFDPQV